MILVTGPSKAGAVPPLTAVSVSWAKTHGTRIRELKKVMPNTRQQMLLRGQNLLGYRHYADDVVDRFVERAVVPTVLMYSAYSTR